MGYRRCTYGNREFDGMVSECGKVCPDEPGFQSHTKKERISTWERNKKYRKRLQRLASIAEKKQVYGKNAMYGGAIYIDEDCHRLVSKPFYRRYWRGGHNNRFKYWLKVSNRKVRRYKGDVHSGGFYRKIFDYWWTVD